MDDVIVSGSVGLNFSRLSNRTVILVKRKEVAGLLITVIGVIYAV